MPVNDVLAGIAVADHDSAVGWYENLLGRPPDTTPMPGLAEWHFPEIGSIQVIHDAERAGSSLLTLGVDDLREEVAALQGKGLALGPIDDTTSDKVLFTAVTDPDGNTITLVEERS
jgi:catechol 2,3-dioxygenase-like lactoylglutathione lyase family enzyme